MGTKINRQILTDNFSPEKLTGFFQNNSQFLTGICLSKYWTIFDYYSMPQSFLRRSIVSGQFACLGRQTVCCFPYLPFQETASSAATAFIHSTRTTYSPSSPSLDRQYSPDSGSEKNGVPLIFTDAAGAADALTMQQPTKPHPGIFTQTRSPGESSKSGCQ